MKIIKFNNIILALATALFVGLTACEKEANFREFTYPAHTASGISPGIGFPTQTVTITGKDFGTLPQAVKVYFNGILATSVISCTNEQIVVQVPVNAISGSVSLKIWNTTSENVGNYTVLPLPIISSVASRGNIASVVAQTGDTVYLKGKNFLTTAADVAVDFNGTNAPTITALSDTLIKVITPAGYSAGNVGVKFKGYRVIGLPALSPVLPSGDVSSYFLLNYMHPLQSVETTVPTTTGSVRWFTPQFWTVTDNIKNHNNGTSSNGGTGQPAGGFDYRPFKDTAGVNRFQFVFGVEAGWGAANIVNGKIQQNTTLPAGNYRIETRMRQNGFAGKQVFICATSSNSLPDGGSINASTTLGFKAIDPTTHDAGANDTRYDDFSFDFTVSARTDVTLGFVIPSFTGTSSAGMFVRFEYIKLIKL